MSWFNKNNIPIPKSGSLETANGSGSSSSHETSPSAEASPSAIDGKPEWTDISFRRQESFRQSNKSMHDVIRQRADERLAMQEKTFRKWINVHLAKASHPTVDDLFSDLRDGVRLLALIELLTGAKLPREKGKLRVHAINNINQALQFLHDQKVHLVNINASDLADGNPKITLGLIWHIIQHHWKNILMLYASEEATDFREFSLQQVLKGWCHYSTMDYESVTVSNFTTSWKDGLAFNAILHRYRPGLVDFSALNDKEPNERLENAFQVSEAHLSVPRLLDISDLSSDQIDPKSVMTYLLLLFQALPHDQVSVDVPEFADVASPVAKVPPSPTAVADSPKTSSRSDTKPKKRKVSTAETMKDFQSNLEHVLTWLLDAEEKLSGLLPVCEADVEIVKRQFKEHEEFMLRLTQSQDSVGQALQRGQTLVQSGRLGQEDCAAVHKQITLVNEKWENLRSGAMERQTKLHERLMYLQQTQLDAMRAWLSSIECVIGKTEAIACDPERVHAQNLRHRDIQDQIEMQQAVIVRLSSFVAVVDESHQGEKSYEQLEQVLQDIGKRWMVICQWAEKRAARLDGLAEAIESLGVEQSHFTEWLEQREAALGGLRSAHHLKSVKEVLEQVQNLQAMERDLEAEHPRFVRLSQLSSEVAARLELDNPAPAQDVRRKLEEITQRWDNLVARMEEHSQMLIRSGKVEAKQFKTTVYLEEEQSSNQEAANRLKVEVQSQGQVESGTFEDYYQKLSQWMHKTQAVLALSSEKSLGVEERVKSLQNIQSDIEGHAPDLEKLHSAGHALVESLTVAGQSGAEIESKLHEINSRWRQVQLELVERRENLHTAEADVFRRQLADVDAAVQELSAWADSFDPEAMHDMSNVRLALKQCQDKLEQVKLHEPRVSELQRRLEQLSQTQSDSDVLTCQQEFDSFTAKWATLVERISSALETLSAALESEPDEAGTDAVDAMNDWLLAAEEILLIDDLGTIDHLDINETKIERLKELESQRSDHQQSLEVALAASEQSKEEQDTIRDRWTAVESGISHVLDKLELGNVRLKEWDRYATELDAWLDQVTEFVHAEQPAHGDVEALKAQLEQCQGLVNDMNTLRPKLAQMETCASALKLEAAEALGDYLSHRMDEIDRRWSDVERVTKAKHQSLLEANTRSQKVYGDIEQLSKFLASIEQELSGPVAPESGKELQTLIKRYKELRTELEARSDTVDTAVGLAEQLAASVDASPDLVAQLQAQLRSTRQQWLAILEHVNQRLNTLSDGFENWKEFQELTAAERICLDQLDKKLTEPVAAVGDAEEYCEQLDLLDRLMDGSGQTKTRLDTIAQALVAQNLLKSAVQSELDKLSARREKLMSPAKERKRALESGATESQEFEEILYNSQSWIGHVDYILSTRLDSDILASDVPEEYKRALGSGHLLSQLQQEFDEHGTGIESLNARVSNYKKQRGAQAAVRFDEQLKHVQDQFEQLRAKFVEFKRPRDFEQRLERVFKIIADVRQGIELLKPDALDCEALGVQRDKVQEVQATVSQLTAEVESVHDTASRFEAEGMVELSKETKLRLEQLNGEQATLVQQVSSANGRLEEACALMAKMEDERKQLVQFLQQTELSLANWEAAEPGAINQDVQFIEQLQQEMPRRESGLNALLNYLKEWQSLGTDQSFSALSAQMDSLRERWKDLQRRIEKWSEYLKNMRKDNDALLREFEAIVPQVKQWLSGAEMATRVLHANANKLEGTPEPEMVQKYEKLHAESSDIRPKIDQLRDKAVELAGRGEDFQMRVEPDLTDVNTRWEAIHESLRQVQKRFQLAASASSEALDTESVPEAAASSQRRVLRMQRSEAFREPTPVTPPSTPTRQSAQDPELADKITRLSQTLTTVEELIDFESQPPASVPEWQKRVNDANETMENARPDLESVLKQGQELANAGPMELHVQNTLDKIDQLNGAVRNFDSSIEKELSSVSDMSDRYQAYLAEIFVWSDWCSKALNREPLDEAAIRAIQDEYLERKPQLETLRLQASKLQNQLPGRCDEETMEPALSRLEQQRFALESRLRTIPTASAEHTAVLGAEDPVARTQLEQQMAAMAGVSIALETVQSVTQLESSLKAIENRLQADQQGKDGAGGYGNFSEQEDTLKALKENLVSADAVSEALKASVKRMEASGANAQDQKRLNLLLASVQTRISRLKEMQANREKAYVDRLGVWQRFQTDVHSVGQFIEGAEASLADWRTRNGNIDTETLERLHLDLEKEMVQQGGVLEKVSWEASSIAPSLSPPEQTLLKDKLETISRRWQLLVSEVADHRERIEERQAENTDLRDEVDEMLFWCDETEALMSTSMDPSYRAGLADILQKHNERHVEVPEKQQRLKSLEHAKEKFVSLRMVPNNAKQKMRRDVAELQSRVSKVRLELDKRRSVLDDRLKQCKEFWDKLDELDAWVNKTMGLLEEYHSAVIYTPTRLDPTQLDAEIRSKQTQVDDLSRLYNTMRDEAKLETDSGDVASETKAAVDQLLTNWSVVLGLAAVLRTTGSAPSSTHGSVTIDDAPRQENGHVEDAYAPIIKRQVGLETASTAEDKLSDSDSGKLVVVAKEQPTSVETHVSKAMQQYQQLSPRSSEQMKELIHMRHWLSDTEREMGGAVDLTNLFAIKEAVKNQQSFLDLLQTKRLNLIRILEVARDNEVQHKAQVISREWERSVAGANRRKRQLTSLLEDSRTFEQMKVQMELWLTDGHQKVTNGPKVSECTEEELQQEMKVVESFLGELEVYKHKMTELNQQANLLLDTYPDDDGTALSHSVSELNTQWSKFNDNVRIRRAVLEASSRSRKDFQSALGEFETWLRKMEASAVQLEADTDNPQLVKDAHRRRDWMDREKELRLEMTAHEDVLNSLREMGQSLADTLEPDSSEKQRLTKRLQAMNERWAQMHQANGKVRDRLESAQEQWERLSTNLKELIYWTETEERMLMAQQPVGGDLTQVTEQTQFIQNLQIEIDKRQPDVKETVKMSHGFLMQQDLRPRLHSPEEEDQVDEVTLARRKARRMAHQIKVECDTLEQKWKILGERSVKWNKIIQDALAKMKEFDQAINSCDLNLLKAENSRRAWKPVADVQLDDLPNQMNRAKSFRQQLTNVRAFVDDVNDQCSRLLADNIQISPSATQTLEALNNRYKQLETAVVQRIQALEAAIRDFGPSSQHFLMSSVQSPWERSISANRVPYFINHENEATQWDHPKMTDIMNRLCDFNEVKFSAYRTAMKLRALQKRLCLDLVVLDVLDAIFRKSKLSDANDRLMDVSELVMTLLPIYEKVQSEYNQLLKSLPLAIDLCLNFMLNVYDPSRSGSIRVLSFKVALVLLCRAHLEDKYRYLFNQLSTSGVGIDPKKLALLLHDCVQLPKYLGEVAAFGGSNVEPSVRSCFERVKFPPEVTLSVYLDWLKCEPQSLVWMPVMHRVAAAETTKHQAKCNVCKMFPIIGLRYRCLSCFNFDMCQNCFYSQRTSKSHKITHPMQEYCITTTSGEDMRDLGRVMKNKFRSKSRSRSQKLGYLPLQSVVEGSPIESRSTTPSNAETQHLHGRLELFANKLVEMDTKSAQSPEREKGEDEHSAIASLTNSLAPSPRLADVSPVGPPRLPVGLQSPAQIVSQIDHMQKEELDQILQQLEDENKQLQIEYERLRGSSGIQGALSTPHLMTNGSLGRRQSGQTGVSAGRSMGSLPRHLVNATTATTATTVSSIGEPREIVSEEDLLAEARALRQHKQRLEERSRVLEDHNRQLEVQLLRLKHLIDEQQLPDMNGSIMSSQSQQSGTPASPSRHTSLSRGFQLQAPILSEDERDSSGQDQTGSRFENLMSTAQDLGRAMGTFVCAVTSDDELSQSDED